MDEELAELRPRAAQTALDRAQLDRHDLGRLVVAEPLHVAQNHGEALVGRQTLDGRLNLTRRFGTQTVLFRTDAGVGHALGRADVVLRIGRAHRIQAVHGSPLTTTQLVVARVYRDPQQPRAKASRATVEGPQPAKRAEQRILGGVGSILGVAQGAVTQVEDLPLVGQHQSVERGEVATLSRLERAFDRARLGLHSSMLPSKGVRYGYPAVSVLRWLPSLVLLVPWLLGPAAPSTSERISDVAAPVSFRLLDWETLHVGERVGRLWGGLFGPADPSPSDADTLRAYFQAGSRRPELRSAAEAAIERAVSDAYRDGGLGRSQPLPLGGLFPPVLVALTPPPNVLVVSPRSELRVIESAVLQAMDTPRQEQLEASADSSNLSSLVAPIGGLATYPSMVLEEDAPDRVLSSVAHEWLHQYLIFYPLGAGYWNSQETREINETTADMVGQEVGGTLARSLGLAPTRSGATGNPSRPAFDFRAFMRETRLRTEQLLAAGDVDGAEAYMRERRDELQQHGYAIRKLNQAYFALYGSYGEGFAASPSNPIPGLLHTLRDQSPSLGDFVVRVREITSVDQLRLAAS